MKNAKFTKPAPMPRLEENAIKRKDATIRVAYSRIQKLENEVLFLRKLLVANMKVVKNADGN